MIQYNIFPEGKIRVVTFSYDDGHANDERLVGLFNKYKVKGTFHLCSDRHNLADEDVVKNLRERYAGHEIACHTVHHAFPFMVNRQSFVGEIMKDRLALEKVAQYPVVGMSYPYGQVNDEIEEICKMCGIVYSRATGNTGYYSTPTDFLKWQPTCHHKDGVYYGKEFIANLSSEWRPPLLYIWGHSHELTEDAHWENMENILKTVSGNDKIWYATNIEIYNYMTAQRRLIISADETMFYNPTDIDVWVEKDKKQVIHIPAGKKITL